MKEIQNYLIQQMAYESDVQKTGRWAESDNKSLVLLDQYSIRVMTENRIKKFNVKRHSSKMPIPEMVALTSYLNQELTWALVYGNKKIGRRYDLRPLHDGKEAAIIEIYDNDIKAGFAGIFENKRYFLRNGIVDDALSHSHIAYILGSGKDVKIKLSNGQLFVFQPGDNIHITEEPEKLKPDLILDSAGKILIELHFSYRLFIKEQTAIDILAPLLMVLFDLKRNPIR